MSAPEERPDPAGTVYGGRPARPPRRRWPTRCCGSRWRSGWSAYSWGCLRHRAAAAATTSRLVPASVGTRPPRRRHPATRPASRARPHRPSRRRPRRPARRPPRPPGPGCCGAASGLCLGLDGDDAEGGGRAGRLHRRPGAAVGGQPGRRGRGDVDQRRHGQCLDVEGGSTDDGATVAAVPCHGEANQQWRLAPTGAGPVLLVAVHSGKCAQADDDGDEAGDEIRQRPCDGAPGPAVDAGLTGRPCRLSPGSSRPWARSRRPARRSGTGAARSAAQQQRQPGGADRQRAGHVPGQGVVAESVPDQPRARSRRPPRRSGGRRTPSRTRSRRSRRSTPGTAPRSAARWPPSPGRRRR